MKLYFMSCIHHAPWCPFHTGSVRFFAGTQARRVVLRAFRHISQRTCIKFRERKGSDPDFIKFISEPG